MSTQPSRRRLRRRRTALARITAALVAAVACDALAQTQATWLSPASGTFTDPARWSTNPYYPTAGNPAGSSYDATIAAAGAAYTVSLPTSVTLDTLTIGGSATLRHSYGTLRVDRLVIDGPSASYSVSGAGTPFGLDARTIQLNNGGTISLFFGNHLTLAGDVTVQGHGSFSIPGSSPLASVVVAGTTTLNATASFTGGGSAYFTGPGSLVNRGSLSVGLSGVVDQDLLVDTPSFVNYGTITSRSATISHLTNAPGALVQLDLGTISDLVTNAGTIRVSTGSAITIGGTVTPDRVGNIEGAVVFSSTLDLAGSDYSLPAGTNATVQNGTLRNGTLRAPSPANPFTISGNGALSNVTLGGAVNVGDPLHVAPTTITATGLALDNATLTLRGSSGNYKTFLFLPASVSGTGLITFGNGAADPAGNTLAPSIGLPSSTLAPGITVSSSTTGSGTLGTPTQPLHVLGTVACPAGNLTITGPGWSVARFDLSGTGALHLAGSFTTPSLGPVHRTGGTLTIDGTLDNSSSTLDLASTGNLSLAGTIRGGTLASSDGSALSTTSYSTLDAVTLDLDFKSPLPSLNFKNGLTLANGRTLPFDYGSRLSGTGAISGSGTILLSDSQTLPLSSSITADALGPGITVRTGTVASPSAPSSVGLNVPSLQGNVSVQTPGFSVYLTGANWTNSGSISLSNGTLALAGSFTPSSLGNFVRTGGSVQVAGALNLPPGDDTLTLDASTGPWDFVANATVNGGTVRTADNAVARVNGNVAFNNVTLAGTLSVVANSTLDTGAAGLTLDNATVNVGTGTVIGSGPTLRGPVSGTGRINFAGYGTVNPNAASYTYAPTLSFSASNAVGSIGTAGQSITTQGPISVSTAGTLLLAASHFTNAGQITATHGGTLGLNPATFVNHGTLDIADGALRLIGTSSTADYRALGLPPTPVSVAGVLNNTGDSLASTPASPLTLMPNSVVNGGTLTGSPDAPLVVGNATSTT